MIIRPILILISSLFPILGAYAADSYREYDIALGQGKWSVTSTVSIPLGSGPFPAVVLVHGSGPGLRDLPVGGSAIFRDLAHGLAEHGIAVLRYDKRTTTHAEEFEKLGRRATLDEEFVADATSAALYLRQLATIDVNNIYILGHSQGAGLAPRIANNVTARGAILVAGSTRRAGDIILQQASYGLKLAGNNKVARKEAQGVIEAAQKIQEGRRPAEEVLLGSPAWYWRSVDATRPLEQIESLVHRDGRVMIVHGGRDTMVTSEDRLAWHSQLPSSSSVTYLLYPSLNHLMQTGEGKMSPVEYEWTQPVDATLISELAKWIKQK